MTKLYAPKVPTFFLACGGMAPKYCNDTAAAVRQMNAAGMKNVVFMVRLELLRCGDSFLLVDEIEADAAGNE